MFRSRRLSMLLALAALMLLTVTVSSAAPGPQGKGNGKEKAAKARLSWSIKRVEQTLAAGQSATVTVKLLSSIDVENLTLRLSGGLGRVTKVSPAGAFNLKANSPVDVMLTMSLSADARESQGGVVQVRMGKRSLPESLKVLVRVAGDTDTDDDTTDEADKAKDAAGQVKGKAKGQGKNNGKGNQ